MSNNQSKRVSSPKVKNEFYHSNKNEMYMLKYRLPNLKVYIYGRLLELGLNPFSFPDCELGAYYDTLKQLGFKTSNTPQVGDLVVFRCMMDYKTFAPHNKGHLGIVEEVRENSIIISSYNLIKPDFYNQELFKDANYNFTYINKYKCIGFVRFEKVKPTKIKVEKTKTTRERKKKN